jgi:predicted AlkP superfamily pyrophosphatase or phosphodiesterase
MRLAGTTALLALFAAVSPAAAQPAAPKLIVAISVDQLSADLFQQYRPHFGGGLNRLAQGTLFPSGYQAHASTETCPGHSTILTGARPARTGIIANAWFNLTAPRDDKYVYCAEDERVAGSTSRSYTVSPYHLRVPALGDYLKRADPRSKVAVAAGKDRAAIMMGGHNPDQRWWWSGKAFAGSGAPTPAVTAIDTGVRAALAASRGALTLPPPCEPLSRSIPVAGGAKPVGTHRFAREAGDERAFRASPELDGATLAMAAGLREEMRLGEGPATDLLVIGLSATDHVGHSFGTQGAEMCLQLLALDRELGDFLTYLDGRGLDYLVMLTSDHGGDDIPERNRERQHPEAARVDPALHPTAMGKAIGAALGVQGPILFGDGAFGDIYVDRTLAAAQRERVLAEAVRRYRAAPQVAEVFTAAQLRAAPAPSAAPDQWSLLDRAKASFDPERSGDFYVMLKPRISPLFDTSSGYVTTHGSAWDYDRRVPILFWRKGMTPFEQPQAVDTVDILPTIAALIGLPLPADALDGHCLDLIDGAETSCR